MKNNKQGPKILFVDIETKPILAWVWGLFDQNVSLNQIKEDWCIISWAAKWFDSDKVFQADLRKGINNKNEKQMLKDIWSLLDEADIVVGQNSKSFDVKKLNEQFLKYDMGKPSPYKQEDTLVMSKRNFSPTSQKLEYRSKSLNKKYKKMDHSKFPGFELWKECISGNQVAWKEMATYNIFDVLSTEEYYNILKPWGSSINHDVYREDFKNICSCGSYNLIKRGFTYSNSGKFQIYQCTSCKSYTSSKTNLLNKDKKASLRKNEVS